MKQRVVYIELDFLQRFTEKLMSIPFEKQQCWYNTFSFIAKSQIVLNASKEDVGKVLATNKIVFNLYKRTSEGNNNGAHRWKYNSDMDFPSMEMCSASTLTEDMLSSITMFLTTKDKIVCNRVMKKTGILAYNIDTILDSDFLFNDCGTSLPDDKRQLNGWKSILDQKGINVCNSIILIDNYLLQSNANQNYASKSVSEKIDNNLIPILDALLPKKIDVPFQITLFAIEGSNPFDTLAQSLKDKIKSLRGGDVKINLQICKCKKEFHDRVLITNNIWISSGMGFDLFNAKGFHVNKPTSISILFPYIQSSVPWVEKAYADMLGYAKGVSKNIKYGDDFENRLL